MTARREVTGIKSKLRARLLPAARRLLMLLTILYGLLLAVFVLGVPAQAAAAVPDEMLTAMSLIGPRGHVAELPDPRGQVVDATGHDDAVQPSGRRQAVRAEAAGQAVGLQGVGLRRRVVR